MSVDEKHGWVLGASDTGHIFVLDKDTGKLIKEAYLGMPAWHSGDPQPLSGFWFAGTSSMAIVPSQTILYIAGTDFGQAWKGQFNKSKEKLFCYDYGYRSSPTLKLLWEYQFCTDDDMCADLNAENIVRGWEEQSISFYTLPSPALADGHVYYNSFNGKVYCFGPPYGISSKVCPIEELYGEHAEETELLRDFRDKVLSSTPEGQKMKKLYYKWSPAILEAIEEDEEFREEIKATINELLPRIKILLDNKKREINNESLEKIEKLLNSMESEDASALQSMLTIIKKDIILK